MRDGTHARRRELTVTDMVQEQTEASRLTLQLLTEKSVSSLGLMASR